MKQIHIYFSSVLISFHTYLLRNELGDEAFWKGIKHYSQTYDGKSVTTQDFQLVMEQSSGKSLKAFFDKWVY